MAYVNQPVAFLELPSGGRIFAGDALPALLTDGIYQAGDFFWVTGFPASPTGLALTTFYRCTVGTVLGVSAAQWVGCAIPTEPVNLLYGSQYYGSAQVAFIADRNYEVAAVTANSPVYGSNNFGATLFKVSAGQVSPVLGAGIPLLTNSLNFCTSGILTSTQLGSMVNSTAATSLTQGDMLVLAFTSPASLNGGAMVAATITLNKIL
jgi:hypothetical protein